MYLFTLNKASTKPLTTSTDRFTGTTGDDTFSSSLGGSAGTTNTLNALDSLDGGAGNDVLSVEVRTAVTPLALKNIETISASFSGAVTLGLSGATGLVNLANVSSTENATFTSLPASTVNLSVVGIASDTTEFVFADVSGTAQSVNLEVSSITGAAAAEIQIDGIETIAVTSTGVSVYELAADAATTLSFAGAAAQTVTLDATTLKVSKFDASAATAAVTLTTIDQTGTAADITISGGSGNDTLTFSAESNDVSVSGGAGNDTMVSTVVDLADTINGGDGVDTLQTTMARANVLDAATPTTYRITNVEAISITDAFDGTLVLANIDTSMNTVNLRFADATGGLMTGGDQITGPTGALTVNLGGTSAAATNNTNDMDGALTLVDTGTATTDVLTLNNTAIATTTGLNIDVFNEQAVTSTGYESVVISTGAVSGGAEQEISTLTITPDSTAAAVSLTLRGTNAFDITTSLTTTSTALMTVDASAMTAQAAGTTTFDIASTSQGASGTASITGTSGDDSIVVGAFASTILGGAGNDTLTGGSVADSIDGGAGIDTLTDGGGNDTILGGDGNDTITITGTSSVSVDGGAGNDTVNMGSVLTSGDTLSGGDGTDTLALAAASTAAAAANISAFEVLRLNATSMNQDLVQFTQNTFTRIDYNIAGGSNALTNAAASVTEIRGLAGSTLVSFDRLLDSTSNALTVGAFSNVATTLATVTVDDEETLTIDDGAITTAGTDFTIGTLNADDLVTLNVTGVADLVITNEIAGSFDTLATVNASSNTGTVSILTTSNTKGVAMTGSSTAASTLSGGAGADTITGGAAADSLTGNGGSDVINGAGAADSIFGGAGSDTVTGGEGADTITGGSGNDSIVLTESSSAADVVIINAVVGTSSDSGRVAVTGDDNDTGQDTITGMAWGVDTIQVVATAVVNFEHGDDTFIGTATGDVDTGVQGSFLTTVGLLSMNGNASVADDGDLAITFASPSATLTEARFEAALQYNLTGTAAANTITGGALADTIDGGGGADSITGGTGDDDITGGAGSDKMTGGTGIDTYRSAGIHGQGTAASAVDDADSGTTVTAGDTLTFATTAADNVDRITDFAATDLLDAVTAAVAPTNLAGFTSLATALVANTSYVLYGTYNSGTGVFTAAAAYATTTAQDALFVVGNGTNTLTNTTGIVILDDLTAALAAANIV